MKIYDCFTFFNELDLLELRLELLNNYVDYFVIAEATRTFSNQEKPLYLYENRQRYEKWKDKIVYVQIDKFPNSNNPWDFETNLRNSLYTGIEKAQPHDGILLSDVDEIPHPNLIAQMCIYKYAFLLQDMFYYYFNCLQKTDWPGTQFFRKEDMIHSMQHMREQRIYLDGKHTNSARIKGGWHFSYMGDNENIIKKITSGCHPEIDKPKYITEEHLNTVKNNAQDIFNRQLDKAVNKYISLDYYEKHPIILNFLKKYPKYYKTI